MKILFSARHNMAEQSTQIKWQRGSRGLYFAALKRNHKRTWVFSALVRIDSLFIRITLHQLLVLSIYRQAGHLSKPLSWNAAAFQVFNRLATKRKNWYYWYYWYNWWLLIILILLRVSNVITVASISRHTWHCWSHFSGLLHLDAQTH